MCLSLITSHSYSYSYQNYCMHLNYSYDNCSFLTNNIIIIVTLHKNNISYRLRILNINIIVNKHA